MQTNLKPNLFRRKMELCEDLISVPMNNEKLNNIIFGPFK